MKKEWMKKWQFTVYFPRLPRKTQEASKNGKKWWWKMAKNVAMKNPPFESEEGFTLNNERKWVEYTWWQSAHEEVQQWTGLVYGSRLPLLARFTIHNSQFTYEYKGRVKGTSKQRQASTFSLSLSSFDHSKQRALQGRTQPPADNAECKVQCIETNLTNKHRQNSRKRDKLLSLVENSQEIITNSRRWTSSECSEPIVA